MIYMLSVSLLVLFLMIIWISWNQGFRNSVLWALIPFLLFNFGFAWHTLSDLKGWPYHGTPVQESKLIAAQVQKPWIYILAQASEHEPRLYAIPYSPEKAERIQKAAKQAADGQQMMIRSNMNNDSGELIIYKFNHLTNYSKHDDVGNK